MAGVRVLVFIALLGIGVAAGAAPVAAASMRALDSSDSLLVVAPHPDDETLCCGGTISLARRAGARVSIVWITSGDGSRATAILGAHFLWPRPSVYRDLGSLRTVEARHAASLLGVDADSLYFLGYPDTGIRLLAGANFESPWRSHRTRLEIVAQPGAPGFGSLYEGRSVVADLLSILQKTRPTIVLAPSSLDTHPDHQGVAQLTVRALEEYGALDRLHVWIVHGGKDWPSPRRPEPAIAQRVPTSGRALSWNSVTLDAIAVEEKAVALRAHASARRVMAGKMDGFVRANELFAAFVPTSDPTPVSRITRKD